VVASLSKELNALTVAVVTRPFGFEGSRRMKAAERGLADLASTVDTVITIPNDRLLSLAAKGASFFEAFRMADDVLRQAVQGIADIITTPGLINRDFSDIRAIMNGMGHAMMGTASAQGSRAAVEAAQKAIDSPLMEAGGVKGARGLLINITASSQLGLHEVNEACTLIRAATDNDDVQINFGVVLNESLEDEVKITVIATGFQREVPPELKFEAKRPGPFVEPVFETAPRVVEPEPGPAADEMVEVAAAAIDFPAPAAPPPPKEEPMPLNDLEMPAVLRRSRQVFQ
jgi:cell division protein FtsZ